MRRRSSLLVPGFLLAAALLPAGTAQAQSVDRDQIGAWYMLFWSTRFDGTPIGLQGDVQYRNWDLGGDLEQLLIRGGLTWTPGTLPLLLTAGAAHITSGAFGDSDETSAERRLYQEALLRQSLGDAVFLRHRYRYEQRWVDGQDFRTRFRYALFADIPLNGQGTGAGALYLALYDELFINGERDIGDGRSVERFDRNRIYGALGYGWSDRLKVQGGYMVQTVVGGSKGQIQGSLHVSF
ncbi:MAG: DUF2490 domain-containing protein [Gemmatimonadota bacterium]|nr:DUF2490 domain-containing protein [Gemmatimonadota bacterium]